MTCDDALTSALKASLKVGGPHTVAPQQFDDLLNLPNASIPGEVTYTMHMDSSWPSPESVPIVQHNGARAYDLPGIGPLPSVTTVLKTLGLSKEALIKWAVNLERDAIFAALEAVLATSRRMMTPHEFAQAVEDRLGPIRQHQKALTKAGDMGTMVHQTVQDWLRAKMLDSPAPSTISLPVEGVFALAAFETWFEGSGLTAVRLEQPVWSELGYAGTVDLIASHPERGLGIVDFKTGKGIYDEYHLQVAAYLKAGRNWADLKWGSIVRLPKLKSDPGFEVKELGDMYQRRLTEGELMTAFLGTLEAYRVLVWKP